MSDIVDEIHQLIGFIAGQKTHLLCVLAVRCYTAIVRLGNHGPPGICLETGVEPKLKVYTNKPYGFWSFIKLTRNMEMGTP